MRILLLIAFISYPAWLNAQILVKAQDQSIRYDLIESSHLFYKVTVYDSLGIIKGENYSESIVNADLKNKRIVFARSTQVPFGQHYLDSSIITKNGEPVSLHGSAYPIERELMIGFFRDKVNAHTVIKKVNAYKITSMSEGYFDDNIIENILGYIPFKKGERYHLNCYRYESKSGINGYDIAYILDDCLTTSTGTIANCEVLQYTNGYSSGIYWIDKATHVIMKSIIQIKQMRYLILKA
jgi:hypothetical protein